MILEMVSPVTHSVGNCVKRVVVITSSILFFKTPVSPLNSIGKQLLVVYISKGFVTLVHFIEAIYNHLLNKQVPRLH